MIEQSQKFKKQPKRKLVQIDPKMDRGKFWKYCVRVEAGIQVRSKKIGVPPTIDKHFIDQLFIEQNWRCAISDIPFNAPGKRDPFAPSLDRIVPKLGYVRGNVRLVCNIVNAAMSNWGSDSLIRLFETIDDENAHLRAALKQIADMPAGAKGWKRVAETALEWK